MTNAFFRSMRDVTRQLRFWSLVIVGVILIFIGGGLFRNEVQVQMVTLALGALLIIASTSIEMLVYLQDTRQRFLKDRVLTERKVDRSLTFHVAALEEQVERLREDHINNLSGEMSNEIKSLMSKRLDNYFATIAGKGVFDKLKAAIVEDKGLEQIRLLSSKMQ
jgi:hypothetical protein